MGTFRVGIAVGALDGAEMVDTEALVDTGASYTWLPRDLLDRLGVRPTEERDFILADGRHTSYPIAWVQVRIEGQAQPTIAIFGDAGSEPLLGAFTLEGFGLAADPVNRRLLPVPALLKSCPCPAL
jgi:clan AA aspartic protease